MLQTVKRPAGLLSRVTCPHCWDQFPPERSLWVSAHADLLKDIRLSDQHQQRFLPSRFNIEGLALDAKGMVCHELACPNCHLGIPRALYESEPLFLSIFGAPASGKSYFLAAMTWELRKVLPLRFHLSFSDADPELNRRLAEYEEAVFSNIDGERFAPFRDLILKTQQTGDDYDAVNFGNQIVNYPRPFLFSMRPGDTHRNAQAGDRLGRVICLYDNAGESFQAGQDNAANPVTRHMARSRTLFFVFDPLQEPKFRARCTHPAVNAMPFKARQEPILQEAAARIRKYANLRQSEKHDVPLVVVLTKFDMWSDLLRGVPAEPYIRLDTTSSSRDGLHAVDVASVERLSRRCRELLLELSPEIVTAAETFARDVTYVPVSAVGWNARLAEDGTTLGIRPAEAQPYCVSVPLIYSLAKYSKGLIHRAAAKSS